MDYKLSWREAIKVIFLAKNKGLSILFIFLFFMPLIIYMFATPQDDRSALFFILCVVFLPLVLFAVQNYQSGWSIEGEILKIKAFSMNRKIHIPDAQIGLVTKDGLWCPAYRTWGAGFAGLLVGKCCLNNDKSALVFRHSNQEELMLVIAAEEKYYIISHEGIKALYEALIRLGAQQNDFENLLDKK